MQNSLSKRSWILHNAGVVRAVAIGPRFVFVTGWNEWIAGRYTKWHIYTDQDAGTGWLGYDFIVNQEVIDTTVTTVKRWQNGCWVPAGRASYRVNGNEMELAVSRDLVHETRGDPAFDFHWADNIQGFEGVAELGVNGDSAPNRRWNYRFAVSPCP